MSINFGKILELIETLENLPRIGWLQRGVNRNEAESVAQHTLLTTYLCLFVGFELVRRGVKIDLAKLLTQALIHDLHEALIGNTGHIVRKTFSESWVDFEIKVFNSLELPEEMKNLFKDYRRQESFEGFIVNLMDKLATLLRAYMYKKVGYRTDDLIENYEKQIFDLLNKVNVNALREFTINLIKYVKECVKS